MYFRETIAKMYNVPGAGEGGTVACKTLLPLGKWSIYTEDCFDSMRLADCARAVVRFYFYFLLKRAVLSEETISGCANKEKLNYRLKHRLMVEPLTSIIPCVA